MNTLSTSEHAIICNLSDDELSELISLAENCACTTDLDETQLEYYNALSDEQNKRITRYYVETMKEDELY